MTIVMMGSAGGTLDEEAYVPVRRPCAAIARRGHVLVTRAWPGMPHESVKGAKEKGIAAGGSPAFLFN